MPIDHPPDEPEASRAARRLPLVSLTLRIAAASAVIAGLSLYARATIRPAPPIERPGPAAESEKPFVPSMARPARGAVPAPPDGVRLRLDEPDGLDPVRSEATRPNPVTGLREDSLSRGAFSEIEASHLRLTLTRDAGTESPPGLFVTLVRRAGDGPALSVIRTGARGRIATKFGAVETLEATLSGQARRICTGFATLEAAPVRIDGWLCAPLGRPPEPRAIACALDALRLEDASDPATGAVFRAAESRRDAACAASRPAAMSEPAGRTGSIAARRTAHTKN